MHDGDPRSGLWAAPDATCGDSYHPPLRVWSQPKFVDYAARSW